jgi:2-hydroxy-3-keto-5-methylthiopentenyl-1-phosphate phosphatase
MKPRGKNKLVLVDFDGTITKNDVGALLFNSFSKEKSRKIVSEWLKGKISSKECLQKECELIQITKTQLKNFALSQKIDEHFTDFVDLCKRKGVDLVILSDGLDYYIRLILRKYHLENIPFYSNTLRFEGKRPVPEFPYYDQGCGNCGNCKKYHLRNLRRPKQKVVYIGDGLSDKCAIGEADFVFAKNDLKSFCEKEKISYFKFNDFRDVISVFSREMGTFGMIKSKIQKAKCPSTLSLRTKCKVAIQS